MRCIKDGVALTTSASTRVQNCDDDEKRFCIQGPLNKRIHRHYLSSGNSSKAPKLHQPDERYSRPSKVKLYPHLANPNQSRDFRQAVFFIMLHTSLKVRSIIDHPTELPLSVSSNIYPTDLTVIGIPRTQFCNFINPRCIRRQNTNILVLGCSFSWLLRYSKPIAALTSRTSLQTQHLH